MSFVGQASNGRPIRWLEAVTRSSVALASCRSRKQIAAQRFRARYVGQARAIPRREQEPFYDATILMDAPSRIPYLANGVSPDTASWRNNATSGILLLQKSRCKPTEYVQQRPMRRERLAVLPLLIGFPAAEEPIPAAVNIRSVPMPFHECVARPCAVECEETLRAPARATSNS